MSEKLAASRHGSVGWPTLPRRGVRDSLDDPGLARPSAKKLAPGCGDQPRSRLGAWSCYPGHRNVQSWPTPKRLSPAAILPSAHYQGVRKSRGRHPPKWSRRQAASPGSRSFRSRTSQGKIYSGHRTQTNVRLRHRNHAARRIGLPQKARLTRWIGPQARPGPGQAWSAARTSSAQRHASMIASSWLMYRYVARRPAKNTFVCASAFDASRCSAMFRRS